MYIFKYIQTVRDEYCPVIDEYLNVYGDCEDKRHKNCKLEVVIKNK